MNEFKITKLDKDEEQKKVLQTVVRLATYSTEQINQAASDLKQFKESTQLNQAFMFKFSNLFSKFQMKPYKIESEQVKVKLMEFKLKEIDQSLVISQGELDTRQKQEFYTLNLIGLQETFPTNQKIRMRKESLRVLQWAGAVDDGSKQCFGCWKEKIKSCQMIDPFCASYSIIIVNSQVSKNQRDNINKRYFDIVQSIGNLMLMAMPRRFMFELINLNSNKMINAAIQLSRKTLVQISEHNQIDWFEQKCNKVKASEERLQGLRNAIYFQLQVNQLKLMDLNMPKFEFLCKKDWCIDEDTIALLTRKERLTVVKEEEELINFDSNGNWIPSKRKTGSQTKQKESKPTQQSMSQRQHSRQLD